MVKLFIASIFPLAEEERLLITEGVKTHFFSFSFVFFCV